MWQYTLMLLEDTKKNTWLLTGKPRALWKMSNINPKLQRRTEREKRNFFNCPQVSCDLKINHCHMKSHGKITPFSYGTALKKFRPFIGTVKGEAFELHLSCIESCHVVAVLGSMSRIGLGPGAGFPWCSNNKAFL